MTFHSYVALTKMYAWPPCVNLHPVTIKRVLNAPVDKYYTPEIKIEDKHDTGLHVLTLIFLLIFAVIASTIK